MPTTQTKNKYAEKNWWTVNNTFQKYAGGPPLTAVDLICNTTKSECQAFMWFITLPWLSFMADVKANVSRTPLHDSFTRQKKIVLSTTIKIENGHQRLIIYHIINYSYVKIIGNPNKYKTWHLTHTDVYTYTHRDNMGQMKALKKYRR